jgi:hypothetical protein
MVFDWPTDGVVRVPIRNQVKSVDVFGSSATFGIVKDAAGGGSTLRLPGKPVDAACTVVRVRYEGALDPLPFAVYPANDGALVLLPHDATLDGPSLKVEQVGVIGDVKYNLGYWLDPAAFASWPISGQRAGKYRVVAELACEFTVAGTGGWQEYRAVTLGSIEIPAGDTVVSIRAKTKPGEAVVNVRSIRLERVD